MDYTAYKGIQMRETSLKDEAKEFVNRLLLPLLQIDQGNITLVDIQEDIITVEIGGNCLGCPGAIFTYKLIEDLIKKRFPNLKEIRFRGWKPILTHEVSFSDKLDLDSL